MNINGIYLLLRKSLTSKACPLFLHVRYHTHKYLVSDIKNVYIKIQLIAIRDRLAWHLWWFKVVTIFLVSVRNLQFLLCCYPLYHFFVFFSCRQLAKSKCFPLLYDKATTIEMKIINVRIPRTIPIMVGGSYPDLESFGRVNPDSPCKDMFSVGCFCMGDMTVVKLLWTQFLFFSTPMPVLMYLIIAWNLITEVSRCLLLGRWCQYWWWILMIWCFYQVVTWLVFVRCCW